MNPALTLLAVLWALCGFAGWYIACKQDGGIHLMAVLCFFPFLFGGPLILISAIFRGSSVGVEDLMHPIIKL